MVLCLCRLSFRVDTGFFLMFMWFLSFFTCCSGYLLTQLPRLRSPHLQSPIAQMVSLPCSCLLFSFLDLFILSVWVFSLQACLCIMCVPDAFRGQKRVSDPLELQLWVAVSHYGGARKQTGVISRLTSALDCWAIFPALVLLFQISCITFEKLKLVSCIKMLLFALSLTRAPKIINSLNTISFFQFVLVCSWCSIKTYSSEQITSSGTASSEVLCPCLCDHRWISKPHTVVQLCCIELSQVNSARQVCFIDVDPS